MENGILNQEKYQKLVIETENGEKIAEVTAEEATPAEGYIIRLIPQYEN
ncbi:Hypothetical protein Tpal_469 [Trichococcus palustris]|uniref:Uncharacterized protein n=1 Tax=Trichococcus palustris TaxID=140314 RepID=A0A143YA26_9LACT|nr:hypothetical protein [Trichococcus palustris]CZQ83636.1 Hypothetical protein Tpal_469 [Trichococcus palustris]SFK70246.1 hypothetical protein SAMN04488076_103179 [Trichococcus palustris]